MRQDPYVEAAFRQAEKEADRLLQVAGLKPISANVSGCATPDEYRHMVVRMAQKTLPPSAPRSVRAEASPQMTGPDFARHAQRVAEAVEATAHQSPVLRPVVTTDAAGREETMFYGSKRAWMVEFAKPPLLMKTVNGAPVRIPTVL